LNVLDIIRHFISVECEGPTAHFSQNVLHEPLVMERSDDQFKGKSVSMRLDFICVNIFQIQFCPVNWIFMLENSPNQNILVASLWNDIKIKCLLRQKNHLLLLIFDLETAAAVAKDSTLLAISRGILLISCRVWCDDATTKDFLWNREEYKVN
jgi:hypothetical protein